MELTLVGLVVVACLTLGLATTARGAGGTRYDTVTVEPGNTLWSIAATRYPNADTRAKVDEIERLNQLSSPLVEPGEQLRIPAG